jgi:2-keto-3-deoxy-L-rhamnonate aldolase RhmA
VCIDAEHAPFDRAALSVALLAARGVDMPSLVRVSTPQDILTALDLGATGVVVPHVASECDAKEVARLARYGRGGRGYAGSTRSAGYGTRSMGEIMREANTRTTLVAQIEDAEALEQLDAIASVEGIDCLFVGRMDLTVSLGAESPSAEIVIQALESICATARKKAKTIGMFAPGVREALQWADRGASFFLLQSDQHWLLEGASMLAAEMSATTTSKVPETGS